MVYQAGSVVLTSPQTWKLPTKAVRLLANLGVCVCVCVCVCVWPLVTRSLKAVNTDGIPHTAIIIWIEVSTQSLTLIGPNKVISHSATGPEPPDCQPVAAIIGASSLRLCVFVCVRVCVCVRGLFCPSRPRHSSQRWEWQSSSASLLVKHLKSLGGDLCVKSCTEHFKGFCWFVTDNYKHMTDKQSSVCGAATPTCSFTMKI